MIRFLAILALCSCVTFASAATGPGAAPGRARYIVTLTEAPLATYRGGENSPAGPALKATSAEAKGRGRLDARDPDSRAYLAHLDARHGAFLAQAGVKLGRTAYAPHRYRAVANGLALDLTPEEAAALATLPGVARVVPDRNMKLLTDTGPGFIGATQLWGGNVPGVAANRGEGVVIGVIDSGLNFSHPSFAATGGDGYTHTNPRGGFFGQCQQSPGRCNNKLIGIYDFTSEGQKNGTDLDGHGSHVAATAAGNIVQSALPGVNAFLPVSGVAPHANLIVYKACVREEENAFSTCPLSGLISAMDQAVLDGVDVINYSIGGDGGDPWQAVRGGGGADQGSAMLNVRAAGIVPVVAAGNAGPLQGSVSDPGNAPWVIAAANATHTRRFQTTLTGVTGPGVATPQTFVGTAITGGTGTLKIVSGADFGSELCGQGSGEDFPPTGASNPFAPGTFHGEIVVCRRGIQARVTKGYNVLQAGGGGMILVNQAELVDSINSDLHSVPTVHIGYAAGQQLYALLTQAKAQGGNLTGAITAVERLQDGRGDVLAASSSRGPVEPYGGWLKPNLTAPGSDIIAAAQSGAGLAVLSGTSMASPHIAGAAALVLAAHPAWSVSQVESALLTTGIDDVVLPDGTTPATPHEAGGGRAFVPGAVRAGLSFVTSTNSFRSQDPELVDEVAANGVIAAGPASLNMPYLEYGHCLEHCAFTRTATDNGAGGSWTAQLLLPAGATGTVAPSSFVLGQGAQQQLTIQLDVSNPSLAGSWVYGSLVLVNGSGTATNARLPIAVYADPGQVPDSITLDLPSDAGYLERSFSGLARLANPRFKATEIVPLKSDQRTASADLTQADPYDVGTTSGSGAYFFTVPLGNETGQGTAQAPSTLTASLYAQLSSLSARDADLFVGIDTNGNGNPDEAEVLCKQQGPSGDENCVVSASYANGATPPVAWFLVQNLQSGNTLRFKYAAATQDSGIAGTSKSYGRYGALRVTGPGVNASGAPFNTRFAWNAPGLLPGESWLSFLSIAATPEASPFGNIPVLLNASGALSRQPLLLNGNGERVGLRLAGNTAHERIAIDVPAGAESLRIDMSGTGEGDLYLAKSTGEPAPPAIGQAPPRAAAQGTSIHGGGAAETITLTAPTLSAGRWYVTPVNSGPGIADVAISATLASAGPAPSTNDALYYDPQRSGHGVFVSSGSGQWVVVWYTYLEDGTPAWYLAQGAAPGANQLTWTAPLQRFTWDGTRAQGTEVGHATVVRTDADKITLDWYLNGSYGSEPMQRIFGPEGCAFLVNKFVDTSGLWYAPAHSGYGWNVLSFSNTELQVNYLYDASGAPMWLLGQNGGGADFTLSQYSGFCPVCSFQQVQSQAAGTLQRTYIDERSGHAKADASFVAPVPGSWHVDDATLKITRDNACVQDF